MNLKYQILACSLLLGAFAARSAEMPIKVGVRVGANTSVISETRLAPGFIVDHTTEWKPGFTAGAVVEIPMKHNFYLTPGFFFDYRHDDYKMVLTYPVITDGVESLGSRIINGSVKTNWFQIPMLASYRIPLKIIDIKLDFGPYIALGLAGRDKSKEENYNDAIYMESMIITDNTFGKGTDSRYFNIDWGFDVGAGIVIAGHYYIGAHYLIGARNLAQNKAVVSKAHSAQWQLSIGYNF